MKRTVRKGITFFIFCLLISCGKHYKEEAAESDTNFSPQQSELAEMAAVDEDKSDSKEAEMNVKQEDNSTDDMKSAVSSSATRIGKQDSTRKFIRTAELKFKAENVIQTVYTIEDVVAKHDGFISFSSMAGNKNYTEEIPINKDSTLFLTHFTVVSQMIIRVPNVKLDTVLKDIAKQIDFLDYRIIKADDVGLTLRANQLAQKRNNRSAQRIENAIDNRGRRLNETIDAEDILSDKQRGADDAYLSNLSLMDQVEYSTITLSIYQRESISKELVVNEKNIDAYQPGFGSRLFDALGWGGDVLLNIVLFLVNIWPFILIAGVGVFLFKKLKKKKKIID